MIPIDVYARKRTSELIPREAAIEAIGERPLSWTDTPEELQAIIDWDRDIAAIKSVPAVDAIPVEWLERQRENELILLWENVSGRGDAVAAIDDVLEMWEKWKAKSYCPNCGAEMNGRENDG